MTNPILNAPGNYSVNAGSLNGVKDSSAIYGDSVLSGGIAILYIFMSLLSDIASQKYAQMQQKSDISRSAQDMLMKSSLRSLKKVTKRPANCPMMLSNICVIMVLLLMA
ncbi:EspA-like secreted protein [Arsenophonus nasoniae]|uniref:EspA-like secreted protein n=1 Tax=Arsenophonus nasoniae TaxID=638 RepID=A0A4P7KZ90_9GAMM|nr:EspA-like secreted protein [Arsenophonus nasoniae]